MLNTINNDVVLIISQVNNCSVMYRNNCTEINVLLCVHAATVVSEGAACRASSSTWASLARAALLAFFLWYWLSLAESEAGLESQSSDPELGGRLVSLGPDLFRLQAGCCLNCRAQV